MSLSRGGRRREIGNHSDCARCQECLSTAVVLRTVFLHAAITQNVSDSLIHSSRALPMELPKYMQKQIRAFAQPLSRIAILLFLFARRKCHISHADGFKSPGKSSV